MHKAMSDCNGWFRCALQSYRLVRGKHYRLVRGKHYRLVRGKHSRLVRGYHYRYDEAQECTT